ncbi:phosphotransferase [Gracilibacillus alcaliphilus]|uniref:phosphotransferase n=1 Tax=Gracilibacillus alcaliphilus TaxID=1401441 RepID=UPI00195B39AC|nr:phosphotransferase [Gracilibacillus alcaliphilus]MBM7678545.1 spore coat protein YsxE [Gracilibacillus alcaliphilus]
MNWTEIMTAFQLQPQEIEQVTDKVYKIRANDQHYALKCMIYQEENCGKWLAIQQYLEQNRIYAFAPIIYTKDSQPVYTDQQMVYYVMPWIERANQDQPVDEYVTVMHAIGQLHGATMQDHPVQNLKDRQSVMEDQFQGELTQYREQMLQTVRQVEAKRFMSPVDLQLCMYYRDMEQIFDKLELWQSEYLTQLETTDHMKYCLCHGNLQPSHYVLANSYTYLLNWESAYMTSPTYDLAVYFRYLFQYHDCDVTKLKETFSIYCQYVPLTDFEKSLLAMQLLSPVPLFDSLTAQSNPQRDILTVSMDMERAYRTLLFSYEMQEYMYRQLDSAVD